MISLETARTLLEGMRPRRELLDFAGALMNETDDPAGVLELFHTPGLYAESYRQWVNGGRPESGWLYPQGQDPARELDVDMDAARDAFLLGTLGVQL